MISGKHVRFPANVMLDYCRSGMTIVQIIQDVLRRLHQVGMDVSNPRAIRFERVGDTAHFYGPSRPS